MKRIIKLAALAFALLLLALPAQAESAGPALVVDDAGLLTEAEWEALELKAEEISEASGMDVAILTAPDSRGQTVQDFADDYFDYNGYGQGADRDGVMLVLSMAERDWWITTRGSAIRAFTDYGIRRIGEDIVSELSAGNYYRAFDRFLDDADTFIREAAENQPYDVNHEYNGIPRSVGQKLTGSLPFAGIAALLTSLIGTSRMKSSLRTVRRQRNATQYARKDSLQVTRAQDIFLYHTQMRQRRVESSGNSGGGGGSSTHVSSSGATHGGGGGKF